MDGKKLTVEIIRRASTAKTVEEFTGIMKAEGIIIDEDEAVIMMKGMCPVEGELSDDQMEAVAGGTTVITDRCPFCQAEGAGRIHTEIDDEVNRAHYVMDRCKNCGRTLFCSVTYY